MEQMERISRMEELLNFSSEAIKELAKALDKYEKAAEAVSTLSNYYGSNEWKQDYAADEAGLLPKDLRRGVLSEDGIWNMLSEWQELREQMMRISNKQSTTR